MNEIRLTRSETDKWVAGVCAGLATYINIDPVIVRGLFALLFFASGIGVPLYLILWFIMPTQSSDNHSNADVMGANLEDMSHTVSDKVNKIGRPATVGTLFIMLGGFFLLQEIGIASWLGGLFWPVLIIGIGVYLFARRTKLNKEEVTQEDES